VAERAEVSERTVYRHFLTEQGLHDAMMCQLELDAGIRFEDWKLEDLPEALGRMFASLPKFAARAASPANVDFAPAERRRRVAIQDATAGVTGDCTDKQRLLIAAVLDVFCTAATYERVVKTEGLNHRDASAGLIWAMRVLVEALRDGNRPMLADNDFVDD